MAGTLTATISAVTAATSVPAAFAGSGQLDVAALSPSYAVPAALLGAGTLSAPTFARYPCAAGLSGEGTLSATGVGSYPRTASFGSTGQLMATAAAVSADPTFDAVGAGLSSTTAGTVFSSTHVGAAGATAVICAQWFITIPGVRRVTATFNGTVMRQISPDYPSAGMGLALFVTPVGAVTGGTDTIQLTFDANITNLALNSVSYTNVVAYGPIPSVGPNPFASASSFSLNVPAATHQVAVCMFGGSSGSNRPFTSFNQTERVNMNVNAGNAVLSLGDAVGAGSSISFTAAAAGAISWSAAGVALSGVPIGPTLDVSATLQANAVNATTAMTWTQQVVAGSYGLIAMCNNGSAQSAAAATVKIGTATLTYLGQVLINNIATNGYLALFGGNTSGSGVQTCSVTHGDTGRNFTGQLHSATFTNVGAVGTLQTAFGSSALASVTVPSAANRLVVGALGKLGSGSGFTAGSFTLYQRQAGLSLPWGLFGDGPGAASTTVSAALVSAGWAALGLSLSS